MAENEKAAEVDQILARRQGDTSPVEYLVRWRAGRRDSWEPQDSVRPLAAGDGGVRYKTLKSRLRVSPEPAPRSSLIPPTAMRIVGSRRLRVIRRRDRDDGVTVAVRVRKQRRRRKQHSAPAGLATKIARWSTKQRAAMRNADSSDEGVRYSLATPGAAKTAAKRPMAVGSAPPINGRCTYASSDTDAEVTFKHSPRKVTKRDTNMKAVRPVPRTPPSSPLPCPLSLCTSPPAGPPWDAPPLVPVQSVRPNSPVLLSPTPAAFRALVHAPPARGRAGGEEGALRRMSVRQCESAYHYKDIVVKKCASYTQLWLVTQTRAKNALNPQVLQELCHALHNAQFDDSRVVMLSGSGSVFCSGVDISYLLSGPDRRTTARAMANAIREFVAMLVAFPKPIVAAVNGPAIGLGVALLPLCDVVYASDKASFMCPYARLAQTPEACASYTFSQVMGPAKANEMLLGGRKITAIEAYQVGLVSQVFWPTSLMQEVTPRVQHMAAQSSRALECTKLLMRSHQRSRLHMTNESECQLLTERWSTAECQRAIRSYIDDELDLVW